VTGGELPASVEAQTIDEQTRRLTLKTSFAVVYYAALRPEQAAMLSKPDLQLPTADLRRFGSRPLDCSEGCPRWDLNAHWAGLEPVHGTSADLVEHLDLAILGAERGRGDQIWCCPRPVVRIRVPRVTYPSRYPR
jgi:hypothetical protein